MPLPHGRDRASQRRDGSWAILAPIGKGWHARRSRTRISAEHPGTAISWYGELFEVVGVEEPRGGGVRYALARWEDRHTIRVLENYDDASEDRRARERADAVRRRNCRRWLLALSLLAGHAPAEVQERWEREYDAPASIITLISALPLFLFGVICALALTIRGIAGVALLPLPTWALIGGVYLLVESGMRLSAAWGEGRPAGSLAGSLAWEIARRAAPRLGGGELN